MNRRDTLKTGLALVVAPAARKPLALPAPAPRPTTLAIRPPQPRPLSCIVGEIVTPGGDTVSTIVRVWGTDGPPPGCRLCPHHECIAHKGVCCILFNRALPEESAVYAIRPRD